MGEGRCEPQIQHAQEGEQLCPTLIQFPLRETPVGTGWGQSPREARRVDFGDTYGQARKPLWPWDKQLRS